VQRRLEGFARMLCVMLEVWGPLLNTRHCLELVLLAPMGATRTTSTDRSCKNCRFPDMQIRKHNAGPIIFVHGPGPVPTMCLRAQARPFPSLPLGFCQGFEVDYLRPLRTPNGTTAWHQHVSHNIRNTCSIEEHVCTTKCRHCIAVPRCVGVGIKAQTCSEHRQRGDMRRMMGRTRRLCGFTLESCPVKLLLKKPRGKGSYLGTCDVLLPHETLHAFFKRSSASMWEKGFLGPSGEAGFLEYWRRDAQHYTDHPVHTQPRDVIRRTCPVGS
jgi:hypothetical protein